MPDSEDQNVTTKVPAAERSCSSLQYFCFLFFYSSSSFLFVKECNGSKPSLRIGGIDYHPAAPCIADVEIYGRHEIPNVNNTV